VVSQHVVLLTWPPDGRYSPLSAQPQPQQQQHETEAQAQSAEEEGLADGYSVQLPVRALVLPLQLYGQGSSKHVTSVTLQWSCQGSDADLAAGFTSAGKTLGSKQMRPVGEQQGPAADAAANGDDSDSQSGAEQGYLLEQPQMFAAAVPLERQKLLRSCGIGSSSSAAAGVVLLRVTVTDDAGGESSSELRPVLLPTQPAAAAAAAEAAAAAGVGATAASRVQSTSEGQLIEALAAARAGHDTADISGSTGGSSSLLAAGHLPLPSRLAERLLLSFDGPAFAVRLFFAGWLAQVLGLLLLPR
jgi:hypothetical protein